MSTPDHLNPTIPTTARHAQEAPTMTRSERRTAVKLTVLDPALLMFFVAGLFIIGTLAALGTVGLGWLLVDGTVWLVLGTGLVLNTHRSAKRQVASGRWPVRVHP